MNCILFVDQMKDESAIFLYLKIKEKKKSVTARRCNLVSLFNLKEEKKVTKSKSDQLLL